MPSISSLLHNVVVQSALGIVGLILVGSVTYYLIESTPPKIVYASVTKGNIAESVTATGTVSPVQNPTLSFEQGGQVKSVNATVGEKVTAGTVLASLDTSVLEASLAAAQATLNQTEAGPRAVDVAGQQTAVSNAQQTLTNTYNDYPQTLASTLAGAEGAVYTDTDPLFNLSNKNDPTLDLSTVNPSIGITADMERSSLIQVFASWQAELSAAGSTLTPAQIQSLTSDSLGYLNQERTFLNDLIAALNDAQVGTNSTTVAQQSADLAQANAALSTVNGLISSLTAAGQSVTSEQLALQSAQDQLNETEAGATTQTIQAQQAQVAGIEAQIAQQEIIAPFNGTVSSVSIKPGDSVAADSQAISLVPTGNFEVDIYLAETDVTQLKTGDSADITLDAYGSGRIFPATVSSIDTSPSTDPVSGQTGYKVQLVFVNNDPAISNGMHANVTIHSTSAQNVLLVPKSAVITNGTQEFVLQETQQGLVKVPVTTGISDQDNIEILSGLAEGDQVSEVGSQ